MEAGNAKEMQEVLEWATTTIDVSDEVLEETEDWENEVVSWVRELQDKAKAALATPPRNCDVGTAEEQGRRFLQFCTARECMFCNLGGDAGTHSRYPSCDLAWGQLPYEAAQEGGEA